MPEQRQVTAFVEALSRPRWSLAYNPWGQRDDLDAHRDAAARRRQRLAAHLRVDPVVVLVGEAPGYAGCRYSGMAFTSERLLLEGAIPRIPDLLGQRISTRNRPWSEPAATVIWETLYQLGLAERTVLWNQFAFHPYKSEAAPHTNRPPTPGERQQGLPLLEHFLSLYPQVPVIAVGRQAQSSLAALGVEYEQAVRHPSMGGKAEFQAGLRQWWVNGC